MTDSLLLSNAALALQRGLIPWLNGSSRSGLGLISRGFHPVSLQHQYPSKERWEKQSVGAHAPFAHYTITWELILKCALSDL